MYLKINDSSTFIFSMFVSEEVALFSLLMIIIYLTEFLFLLDVIIKCWVEKKNSIFLSPSYHIGI